MNKTTKIIAGACLGLVGMGCLAGCDSKLNIDQQALNDVMTQTNNYFEMQNSSESVRNVLMKYLFDNIKNTANDTSFQLKKTEYYHLPQLGITKNIPENDIDYKYFYNKDTKTIKYLAKYCAGDGEREEHYREIAQTQTVGNTSYTVKDYVNREQEKILTTKTTDDEYDIDPFEYYDSTLYGVTSAKDISAHFITLIEGWAELCNPSFSMNVEGDVVEFSLMFPIVNVDGTYLESAQITQIDIKFVNGQLSSCSCISSLSENFEPITMVISNYEFTRNIQEFTFDTTGYVEA